MRWAGLWLRRSCNISSGSSGIIGLRSSRPVPSLINRCIYSLTGVWPTIAKLSVDDKKTIETHWADEVTSVDYRQDDGQCDDRCYVLSMFPYPSGNLHMGHVRVYTIGDVIARYQRMNGKKVLQPMGWDAFGLPAENAAIERGVDPHTWTKKNIATMKKQLQRFNYSFDWSREFSTCDPAYYKWTQFLFLKLLEKGLAYRSRAVVNWDPVDETVLADEQVDDDGRSWRSGALVEKRSLEQWFVRSVAFSEALSEELSDPSLLHWPSSVRKVQQHWIGACVGSRFTFKLLSKGESTDLFVWTDTPEAIYGAAFICLAPSHPLTKKIDSPVGEVRLNVSAVHPLTNDVVPVFVSSEAPYPENCDAYLGIPGATAEAHDFAERHGLTVRQVIETNGDETIIINSDQFSGLKADDARRQICDHAKRLGVGSGMTSSKLRDWLISRQRYWGTPIPVIHCPKCKAVPVPVKDLPVKLPLCTAGAARTNRIDDDWVKTTCPRCGGVASRETDTMDTFVDSSWYFLRFIDPQNVDEPFSKQTVDRWMPVDIYIGGMEHAFLHLYYARLVNHFWHNLGMVTHKEPFRRLLVQGLVKGRTYRRKDTGQYLRPDQVVDSTKKGTKFTEKSSGAAVDMTWEKMSKSKYNGVEPDNVLDEYGIDTTRLFILAGVSPATERNWSSDLFAGVLNWQQKLWDLITKLWKLRSAHASMRHCISDEEYARWQNELFESRNNCIKRVNYGFQSAYAFNGAISYMQSLTKTLQKVPPVVACHSSEYELAIADLLRLLAPLAPHFASELWLGLTRAPHRICFDSRWEKNVLSQSWPEVDLNYNLDLDVMDTAVSENDPVIKCLKLPRHKLDFLTKEQAMQLIRDDDDVTAYIRGRVFRNTEFVCIPSYGAKLKLSFKRCVK